MKIPAFIMIILCPCFLLAQNNTDFPEKEYTQSQFDSDTCCWRKLSNEKRDKQGAELIVSYLKQSSKVRNKHSLNWHAGQLYAFAGDNKNAIKYMRKTYSVLYKWFGGDDGKTWYYYAKGTVAFLEKIPKA